MTTRNRRLFFAALAGAALTTLAGPAAAQAQQYPTKPVRLIVPWPAGGGTDNVARALAEDLGVALGQNVVVDNRGGANGVIGTEAAARAAPDGYTLMLTDIFSHVLNTSLVKKLPYDIVADFAPITQISTVPLLLVVHPSFPAQSVADLVRLAKAQPGTISYASFGLGSQAHIAGEMLKMMGGIDMVHVPYKGGAAALTDTLGGQVPVNFSGINLARQHVLAGKLRALAVTGPVRSKFMPDVPTVAETPGFQGFEASVPFAVWAPAKTPPEIIAKLNATIAKVIGTPRFKQNLESKGTSGDTIGNSPDQMAASVAAYVDRLPRVFQAAGLKAE
jgi:tripartite-type tricarboxylate transporter receptor subunit TctC